MTPSSFETSKYFSITASGDSILTFIETLVYTPFEESLVCIVALVPSKIAVISATLSSWAFTMNLYKYGAGHKVSRVNCSLRRL